MTPRPLLPVCFTAVLLATAATTAAAQGTAAPSGPSATTTATAPVVTHWDAHPTGKYLLELTVPERPMQVDLTISDSAGVPVAMFWPVGDNDGHTMTVTVKDTDLVLTAMAPRGKVEVVLQRKNDQLTGHWSMGDEEKGDLQGHVVQEAKKP